MITAGDNVFYTDNQKITAGSFHPVAVNVIRSFSLIPIFYMGACPDVKGSSLEREISDDFYRSKAVVIVLGKGGDWRSIEDVWAIPELPLALSSRIECLVYRTREVSKTEIDA